MARIGKSFVTFSDVRGMINDLEIPLRSGSALPAISNEWMTLSELRTYTYLNEQNFVSRPSDSFPPFDRIETGIYSPAENPTIRPSGANSFDFTVVAPNGYSATDNVSWLSLSPVSGAETEVVTATLTENTDPTERSAIITLTDPATSQTYQFEVIQQEGSGVDTEPVSLGYDVVDSGDACFNIITPTTYYIPFGELFSTATALYSNSSGTINAPAGFYANGTIHREWNGTTFLSSGLC